MFLKLLGVLCALCGPVAAQVRISEFLASNTQAHPDIVDFEDYPDWIELENTSAEAVSLDGWYLSDSTGNPYKWPFPATATIPARGRLVVWADGYDTEPGKSFPRGYWPWRSFTTEGYHTNFSLSSVGEAVVLSRVEGAGRTPLITAARPTPVAPAQPSVWRYLDDGSNQSTQWRSRAYDDSLWAQGPPQLGYGDNDEATVISYGPSTSNRHITTYLRHTFQAPDPSTLFGVNLRLVADDGAVVYLNGKEIIRQNLPAGEINHTTLAVAPVFQATENNFTSYTLAPSDLLPGENLIAVEVHQVTPDSADVSFDLGLEAITFTAANIVDSHAYGLQLSDISRGRNEAGDWVQLATPTPGKANTSSTVDDLRSSGNEVTVSPAAGIYPDPQTVTLTTTAGTIRYTLNGSIPHDASPAYTEPLVVTATTVIRARAFEAGKPHGSVATRTYFIGENQGQVPYVSVVADPAVLFDDRIGIYYNQHEGVADASQDLHDVYKGKDAPGSLEFFAPGGAPGFRVNGGFRMGGENNWVHAQRALNFSVRGKYGDDAIKYDLFPGTTIPIHTGLTLRDGGDAWSKEMLRDGMWGFITQDQMRVHGSDYRATVVFINGAYWGIHDLRSRWDDAWFFQRFHLNAGEVDHLLYGHVTSGAVTLGVEKGDSTHWLELLDFVQTQDLNDPAVFASLESRVDLDSFIDFIVAESYGNNTSWFHNREFWRPRTPGGRWQWFVPDMDRTIATSQLNSRILRDMLASETLLVRLKTSTVFRHRLAQRFAAHMASTFLPSRIIGIVDQMATEVENEAPRHSARWGSKGGMTASSRASNLRDIKEFANLRPAGIHAEIQTALNLATPAVELALTTESAASGRFLVNGVAVEPSTMKCFPQIPVEIQALPAPGFRFEAWKGAATSTNDKITLLLDGPSTLTAQFVPSGETTTGGALAADTTFRTDASPYVLTSDLIVPPQVTLTIESGVTVLLPAGRHIRVQGSLIVQGTSAAPVHFLGRQNARWGGLSFENPTSPSTLNHLTLRGATRGFDPINAPYALSGLNATLVIDHLDIDHCDGPVFCRGGSIKMAHSRLHTPYTGDCINVKNGQAETRNCDFIGNNAPDTDAIDYDGVVDGLISGCRIYRFQGPNCDGIDVGEQCRNVLIEGNLIYYNSDKGVSVGQGSTVIMRRNLIVGCTLGVGVKDFGSLVTIDQNSFISCPIGVDVYEKNFGDGGGAAVITHSIFSKCSSIPALADSLSTLSVNYSLSDTVPITGTANILADPLFIEPLALNYQLRPESPAINAGDPAHPVDPDNSRADIGALYTYSPADYPYALTQTVVIDELLSNSEAETSDWIELYNRSAVPVDLSGWFLSDSGLDLRKYRLPVGTVLPPGGRTVFYENLHFGQTSLDPGRITPFALSDVGETVHLTSAVNDQLTDYHAQEEFGPTMPGESLGNYYKAGTDSWNFIAMNTATPGQPNSAPRVGPIVISEIMFEPAGHPDSEYIELLNVSDTAVPLFDSSRTNAWRITDGIDFEFSSTTPVTLAPGERVLLVKNRSVFLASFDVPAATQIIEWASGRLSNEGESVQMSRPAGMDAAGIRQFARVDRVSYGISTPWPSEASGSGQALLKITENKYGNEAANWIAGPPSPGLAVPPTPGFAGWISSSGLPPAEEGTTADPDLDGVPNLLEFALGTAPGLTNPQPPMNLALTSDQLEISFTLETDHQGVVVTLEKSPSLQPGSWVPVPTSASPPAGTSQIHRATIPATASHEFYRLIAR